MLQHSYIPYEALIHGIDTYSKVRQLIGVYNSSVVEQSSVDRKASGSNSDINEVYQRIYLKFR